MVALKLDEKNGFYNANKIAIAGQNTTGYCWSKHNRLLLRPVAASCEMMNLRFISRWFPVTTMKER